MKWKAYLPVLLLIPFGLSSQVTRKSKINYASEDGLTITADKYISKRTNPYVLLFHTEGSSRAEYDSIAERFLKMNYNCLAVDLRYGDRYGFSTNETAKRAKENNFSSGLFESSRDIRASVNYIKKISAYPVILLGSSYSATLSLIEGKENPDIKAVIAFSPGDFFLPPYNISEVLSNYNKPVFAAFSKNEYPFIKYNFEETGNGNITTFIPSYSAGQRTSKALLNSTEGSEEYWFALLVFFRSLR